ncbi:hypothetical protein C9374_006257 [Naegleria lovaniensis]|uniref:Replication protein A OB domain-containing protein n=1 Tax=Naegleria lovaniensis TaxID=51637 RepID=A0AA88GNH7_NAELO|nr:uncharacterized protein C9374_006257 [Naegleria lovaniensis]KAG2381268.1 hypothetical protein C9374_006257 [Naegleria lovaniensis]
MPPQLQQSSSPNMFPLLQANADPVSLQYPFPLLCVKRNTSTTTKGNQTFFKIEVKDPMQPNGPSLSMIIMEKPENAAARESLVEGSIINVSKIVRSSSKLYILTNFTVENSRSTSSTSSNHSSTSTTATTQRHISNPSATTTPATSNNNSRPGGAFGNNPSANSATPSSFQRPVNQQASNAQPQNNSRPPLNSSRPSGQQQVAGMNNVQQRPSSLIPQQQKAIPPSNSQTIDLKTKPIVPLVALTPWLSDWVIKARVTRKQDMKCWEKEGRKGNILSITLIDQDSTEIRATFFNEGAIKADSKLREQGVYYFKGGGLKEADRKYNSRIAHKYEISFKDNCIIQEAIDNEAMSIPQGRFSLTPLDQVKDSPSQDKFDIIGLVKTIGDPTEFKSKNENSNTTSKRDITILSKDAYGQIIEAVITLWGDNIKFEEKSIVIFTG